MKVDDYDDLIGKRTLDPWQEEIYNTKGNICVRAGRQVGKSTIISIKAAEFAIHNPNKTVMVIASVERQSYLLFEKILNYLFDKHRRFLKTGVKRPTKHIIQLKNGSMIYSFPAGTSGQGIRGYTIDLLIVDEAAFVDESVYTAIVPALAITKGDIWLLSTPHGKQGYFYRSFNDDSFTKFHVSSEECPRKDENFLKKEKERMTKLQYTQEYIGEFIDELLQFFPTELIKKCMTIQRLPLLSSGLSPPPQVQTISPVGDNFLGVDVARLGEDETTFISVNRKNKERLRMIDMQITTKTYTTESVEKILILDKKYNYKKIYIDDGGLGVAVFDPLLKEGQTKTKVVAINNASRPLDKDEKRKKKILKEDLYNNLLRLMEQGKIDLFDDENLLLSLKSIQYEYGDGGELFIHGDYSHLTEGLIRAAWCMTDKSLNLWCAYS